MLEYKYMNDYMQIDYTNYFDQMYSNFNSQNLNLMCVYLPIGTKVYSLPQIAAIIVI